MSEIINWIDKHIDFIGVSLVVVVVIAIVGLVFIAARSPNDCNKACRQARYLSEVVEECVKLDRYTRDECITMTGALR